MKRLLRICNVLIAILGVLPKVVLTVSGAMKGQRPDITPAYVLAIIKFVVVQAVALGLMQSGTQSYILQVAGTIVPLVIVLADTMLRSSRNKVETAKLVVPEEYR